MVFRRAIVRPPAANFADGLTTVDLGVPDVEKALDEHAAYCRALVDCGLELTRLPADPRFPDSTFVEDAAVITPGGAVLTRPGAPTRRGRSRGHRRSPRLVISRAAAHRGARHARRRRRLRSRDPLVHRHFRTNERGGRAPARAIPRRRRPLVLDRRHPRRRRDPSPEERHRLALRPAARRDRLARRRIRRLRPGTSCVSTRPRTTPPTPSRSTTPFSSPGDSRASSAGSPSSGIARSCSTCRSSRRWTAA